MLRTDTKANCWKTVTKLGSLRVKDMPLFNKINISFLLKKLLNGVINGCLYQ
jgi:hypothetical protein